ncbi:MAG TPA: malto-oligosyltrehalose synthase, partial [Terriglobales bacterium]
LCGPEPKGELAENGIELSIQDALADTQYSHRTAPLYCLVEKILEPGEQLPEEWPVHGTSGYEFMNLLNGIFIETAHAQRFTNIYERFTGLTASVADLVYSSKKLIMHIAMSSEVYVLTNMLAEISASDRYARDFTQKALRDVIRETIACFPVYRTYIDERGEYTQRDRGFVETAIRAARRRNPGMNTSVFSFLRGVLLLEPKRHAIDEAAAREDYRRKLHFALKFQQLTGPVMAKGLEDTVCYIYNRFISVNEVGGSPEHFGISLNEFHAGNQVRATIWPNSMLASSTHDTKRSEDVRARLNVLSEIPTAWSARAVRWRRLNKAYKIALPDGRVVPDLNEEYLLYQTVVGSCPLNLRDPEERERYIGRMQQYIAKALHEGKVNLSWLNDDPEYVEAMNRFIGTILSPTKKGETAFVNDLLGWLPDVAYHGAINSISQTLLKLTAPGVPDTYQGTELIDLSLVDPDNRRPVDYRTRLSDFDALVRSKTDAELCNELLQNDLPSGRGKLFLIHRTLQLRTEWQEVFARGEYVPLAAHGDRPHHVVPFLRKHGDATVIVVAPRFTHTLMRGRSNAPLDDAWGNTHVTVEDLSDRMFENVFTSERFQANDRGQLFLRELCRAFPFVLLRSIGR